MQSCVRASVPLPIRRGRRPTKPSPSSVLNLPVALDPSLRGSPSGARLTLVDSPLSPSVRGVGSPRLTAHRCRGQNWLPRTTRHLQVSTVMRAEGRPSGQGPCQEKSDE